MKPKAIFILCILLLPILTAQTFADEFDKPTLGPNWTWTDPLGDCWYSLTDTPGYLVITVPSGNHDLYPGSNYNAPRLLREASGDFTIETKVVLTPDTNAQAAGLLVWQDSDNFIRLERLFVYWDPQQVVALSAELGGVWGYYTEHSYQSGVTYLKLVRTGNEFRASYSEDGSTWTLLTTITFPVADPLQVGIFGLVQYTNAGITPAFDYFRGADPLQVKVEKELVRDALAELIPTGDDKTDRRIGKAVKRIEQGLEPRLWVDDSTLSEKGKRVFSREKQAVRELMKIDEPPAEVTQAIDDLVAIDESLAQAALDEAASACAVVDPDSKHLQKAQEKMDNAEERLGEGRPDKATYEYGKAWDHAQNAMGKCFR
jgi:regulation of enolase protein 1 (concanavalin A-like superfamily)